MTLHDRIMNILITEEAESWPAEERIIYKTGHRDARHAAAEMASEADELMAEMAAELEWYCDNEKAAAIWAKYNAYKEQSNEQ